MIKIQNSSETVLILHKLQVQAFKLNSFGCVSNVSMSHGSVVLTGTSGTHPCWVIGEINRGSGTVESRFKKDFGSDQNLS